MRERRDHVVDHDDTTRVAVRQGTHQNRIDDREDRGIRADPERHDQNGKRGKARTPAETSDCIPEIASKIIDEIHAAHIAAFLLAFGNRARCAPGRVASLFWCEAAVESELNLTL
jgi:hypothetical protein